MKVTINGKPLHVYDDGTFTKPITNSDVWQYITSGENALTHSLPGCQNYAEGIDKALCNADKLNQWAMAKTPITEFAYYYTGSFANDTIPVASFIGKTLTIGVINDLADMGGWVYTRVGPAAYHMAMSKGHYVLHDIARGLGL